MIHPIKLSCHLGVEQSCGDASQAESEQARERERFVSSRLISPLISHLALLALNQRNCKHTVHG